MPAVDLLEAVTTAGVLAWCAVILWGSGRIQLTTAVIAALVIAAERVAPDRPQPLLRSAIVTDVEHFAITIPVAGVVGGMLVVTAGGLLRTALSGPLTTFHAQPLWVETLEAILLADLLNYAAHRGVHASPFLWRFHAVHHSSREVDWLSAHRSHPVDSVILSVSFLLPLYVVNVTTPLIVGLILNVFEPFWVHSNTRWRAGMIGRFITNPEFHRWHHANEAGAINTNFAGLLPLWDLLFGTLYMPSQQHPKVFGIDRPMSDRYVRQLLDPFGSPASRATPHPPTA